MTGHPWPLFVYPSRACNYRCSYCFTESEPGRPLDTWVVAQWDNIADAAAAAGVPEIRISGGEPFMLPRIRAMCRAVCIRGMRYTLTTNGALLYRHLSWLSQEPPETLWISYHREYLSVAEFVALVREAVRAVPRVGVNVFDTDWDEAFGSAGAQRVKILTQNAVGRATQTRDRELPHIDMITGTELRVASIRRERGAATCVLADRPLLSIDCDGRVYPCCVTLGAPDAEIGDLTREPLADVIERALEPAALLPCSRLLPKIAAGAEGCPLRLYEGN